MAMFRIPESLAQLGKERMGDRPVEGFVYGAGPKKPKIMLVGEAPGEFELVDGIPFIGRAGKELMQSLDSIGLTREDVYITSAVRSRPYRWGKRRERDGTYTDRKYNRPPTKKEILAHAPVLDYEIDILQPSLIVTLGNVGLQRLIGPEAKVTQLHGQLLTQPIQYLAALEDEQYKWTKKTFTMIPTFHPASVFYRPSHRPAIEADWQAIGAYLAKHQ